MRKRRHREGSGRLHPAPRLKTYRVTMTTAVRTFFVCVSVCVTVSVKLLQDMAFCVFECCPGFLGSDRPLGAHLGPHYPLLLSSRCVNFCSLNVDACLALHIGDLRLVLPASPHAVEQVPMDSAPSWFQLNQEEGGSTPTAGGAKRRTEVRNEDEALGGACSLYLHHCECGYLCVCQCG